MLIFEISNPGFKSVTISGPQLLLEDGKSMIFPAPNSNVQFPHTLEEGKGANTWIELEQLRVGLLRNGYTGVTKFKALVHDQAGNKFITKKWMKLDLNVAYNY